VISSIKREVCWKLPCASIKQGFCDQFSKHTIKYNNEMNQLFQLSFQSFLKLHLKFKQIESLLKINYIATLSNLFFNRAQTRKCPILQGGKTLLTRKPTTCNVVGGVLPISGHNLIPKGYVSIKKLILFLNNLHAKFFLFWQ